MGERGWRRWGPVLAWSLGLGACQGETSELCACVECEAVDPETLAQRRGLAPALCVLGDLEVRDALTQGASFGALDAVVEVTGSLRIAGLATHRELPEFAALERVGGSLVIADNPLLEAIGGFPELATVAKDLQITANPRLETLAIGSKLEELRSVTITLNESLPAITGFGKLAALRGTLTAERNEALDELSFPALRSVGTLRVGRGSGPARLLLPLLERVDDELGIEALPGLVELDLSALREVGGPLILRDHASLSAIELPGLGRVGELEIADNPSLVTVSLGQEATAPLSLMHLIVRDNPELSLLRADSGFQTQATSWISFHRNDALTAVEGLGGAEALGAWFVDNRALPAIAWPELAEVGALGVHIGRNDLLVAEGPLFPGLRATPILAIYGNSTLTSEDVDELVTRVDAEVVKAGNNGEEDLLRDPCPWLMDGYCDQVTSDSGARGTGLCAEDPDDCAY